VLGENEEVQWTVQKDSVVYAMLYCSGVRVEVMCCIRKQRTN
jgi:hypothetical protein